MSPKRKILIIIWFIFSWLFLIAISLKPIGVVNTLKLMVKPLLRNIHTPNELTMCNFDNPSDIAGWYCNGTLIELSQEHTYKGSHSLKVTYYSRSLLPGIILEDYTLGPKGEKDWSNFKFFKFSIFNPQDTTLPLHIKIKDIAGRAAEKIFDLRKGGNEISLNLEDIGQLVDLTNIIYLNFYLLNLEKDFVIYLDGLSLEREGLKGKRILDKPIVNFIRLSAPLTAKRGDSVVISASVSISKELRNDYRAFIHISHPQEINKRPSERKWYINADQDPWTPTSKWAIEIPYEIGPINVYIPKNFPCGEYIIQIGLFNSASFGSYYSGSSSKGTMDFTTSFPRLRYTNTDIKDYIVGKIKVLD